MKIISKHHEENINEKFINVSIKKVLILEELSGFFSQGTLPQLFCSQLLGCCLQDGFPPPGNSDQPEPSPALPYGLDLLSSDLFHFHGHYVGRVPTGSVC